MTQLVPTPLLPTAAPAASGVPAQARGVAGDSEVGDESESAQGSPPSYLYIYVPRAQYYCYALGWQLATKWR